MTHRGKQMVLLNLSAAFSALSSFQAESLFCRSSGPSCWDFPRRWCQRPTVQCPGRCLLLCSITQPGTAKGDHSELGVWSHRCTLRTLSSAAPCCPTLKITVNTFKYFPISIRRDNWGSTSQIKPSLRPLHFGSEVKFFLDGAACAQKDSRTLGVYLDPLLALGFEGVCTRAFI